MTTPPSASHRPPAAEITAAVILVAAFAATGVWFALRISPDLPPDEVTWFGISRLFAQSWLPPTDSPASYQYGLITHVPTLYFILMGRLLALNVTGLSDLVFLRLANLVLALATLHFSYHLVRRLGCRPLVRVLVVLILTNILMFTFLAASVNYDNLCNFLAAAALYTAVRFHLERQGHWLLLTGVLMALGGLTKITYLPFALLLVVGMLLLEYRHLPGWRTGLRQTWRRRPAVSGTLLVLLCLLTAANTKLYLGNWLTYHRLQPGMDQVLGVDAALQYRIFARDYIVSQFKSGKLSYAEAMAMTERIRHPGDRNGARYLLQQALREQGQARPERLDRFHYALAWFELTAARVFGIMGHRVLLQSGTELVPYYLLFLLACGCTIRWWRWQSLAGTAPLLLLLAVGYPAIVLFVHCYPTYHHSGSLVLALQGRYVFPVLAPAAILAAHFLTGGDRPPFRGWDWAIALVVAVIFVHGSLPWFLQHVDPGFFVPRP